MRWFRFDAVVPLPVLVSYTTHNEPPANKDKNTLLLQFNGVLLIVVSHNRNWCKFTQVVCPGGQAKGGSLLSGFW